MANICQHTFGIWYFTAKWNRPSLIVIGVKVWIPVTRQQHIPNLLKRLLVFHNTNFIPDKVLVRLKTKEFPKPLALSPPKPQGDPKMWDWHSAVALRILGCFSLAYSLLIRFVLINDESVAGPLKTTSPPGHWGIPFVSSYVVVVLCVCGKSQRVYSIPAVVYLNIACCRPKLYVKILQTCCFLCFKMLIFSEKKKTLTNTCNSPGT